MKFHFGGDLSKMAHSVKANHFCFDKQTNGQVFPFV